MKKNFWKHGIKMTLVVFAVIAAVAGSPVSSHAAATDSATATAVVLAPISILNTGNLVFGHFAAATGGTVVIDTDGSRTKTGAVVLSSNIASSAATFNVSGAADTSYTVTLPLSATLTHTNTIDTMSVNGFNSSSSPAGPSLDGSGDGTLNVGAVLTVANGQATGSYSGTFDVTVEYN